MNLSIDDVTSLWATCGKLRERGRLTARAWCEPQGRRRRKEYDMFEVTGNDERAVCELVGIVKWRVAIVKESDDNGQDDVARPCPP